MDELDGVPFEKRHLRKTVRKETSFEDQVVRYAKVRGWKVRKLISVGITGWPDRFFWRAPRDGIGPGEIRIVEIKGKNTPITVNQETTIAELRAANLPVYVLRDPDMETARGIFA